MNNKMKMKRERKKDTIERKRKQGIKKNEKGKKRKKEYQAHEK